MDSRFKTVEQLTTELAALRAQQKRSQIIGLIGGVSAALAAISSCKIVLSRKGWDEEHNRLGGCSTSPKGGEGRCASPSMLASTR